MTTQMNDKIADRLDGMRTTDHRICKGRKEPYLRVYDERHQRYISFYPHDLLAFCRAVVDKVDGERFTVEETLAWLEHCELLAIQPDIKSINHKKHGIAAVTARHRKEQG